MPRAHRLRSRGVYGAVYRHVRKNVSEARLYDSRRAAGAASRTPRASVEEMQAPHKPTPALWLFGQFAVTGSRAAN